MVDPVWTLQVETVSSYTAEDGTTFENVIETVHWRVTATDGDDSETIYGSTSVPKPTSLETYIDLSTMVEMDSDTKRQTVLGWAEAIEPGFVSEKEAQVIAALEAKQTAPAKAVVNLL